VRGGIGASRRNRAPGVNAGLEQASRQKDPKGDRPAEMAAQPGSGRERDAGCEHEDGESCFEDGPRRAAGQYWAVTIRAPVLMISHVRTRWAAARR